MTNFIAAIDPTRESLAAFVQNFPAYTPVVMLNLLRFREQAAYQADDGQAAPITGREAYATYSRFVLPLLKGVGGRPIWAGAAQVALIAPAGETWDEIVLVRYPVREAFLQMIESAEYRAIVFHRRAALADSRLIANVEAHGFS